MGPMASASLPCASAWERTYWDSMSDSLFLRIHVFALIAQLKEFVDIKRGVQHAVSG